MIYTLLCTALTGLISLTGIFYRNKKKPRSKSKRVNKSLCRGFCGSIYSIHGNGCTGLYAWRRPGIPAAVWNPADVQAIQKSPIADKSSSLDQQGNILIYYRFGCGDCEAVYDSLKEATAGKADIYWVASRQSAGQELLQKYAVPEVPAEVLLSWQPKSKTSPPRVPKPHKTRRRW